MKLQVNPASASGSLQASLLCSWHCSAPPGPCSAKCGRYVNIYPKLSRWVMVALKRNRAFCAFLRYGVCAQDRWCPVSAGAELWRGVRHTDALRQCSQGVCIKGTSPGQACEPGDFKHASGTSSASRSLLLTSEWWRRKPLLTMKKTFKQERRTSSSCIFPQSTCWWPSNTGDSNSTYLLSASS